MGTVTKIGDGALLARYRAGCVGPIIYGKTDCAALCAAAIRAATGKDLLARYRGRYRTKLGWLRVIRREGFASLPEALIAAAGEAELPEIGPEESGSLDLALIASTRFAGPALVQDGFAILRTEGGFAAVPVGEAIKLWRVA